jgi:hypothetical protein
MSRTIESAIAATDHRSRASTPARRKPQNDANLEARPAIQIAPRTIVR